MEYHEVFATSKTAQFHQVQPERLLIFINNPLNLCFYCLLFFRPLNDESTMTASRTAISVLERDFLEIRSKLIDLAACFDRIQRAEGSVEDDPRMNKITQALRILAAQTPGRAEQVELLFSLPYDEHRR
jgi:hypothetical protein